MKYIDLRGRWGCQHNFRMDAHALDDARCGCGPMASCTDDFVKRKTEQPESQH